MKPFPHNRVLYRQRRKIENMFGKLKDWCPAQTRRNRCANILFLAICIAAIIIVWLSQ